MLPNGSEDIRKSIKKFQSLNLHREKAPYDHNRVVLKPKISGSDYVDASNLRIAEKNYIIAPVI